MFFSDFAAGAIRWRLVQPPKRAATKPVASRQGLEQEMDCHRRIRRVRQAGLFLFCGGTLEEYYVAGVRQGIATDGVMSATEKQMRIGLASWRIRYDRHNLIDRALSAVRGCVNLAAN
jgi:hypothetical protein